MAKEITVLKDVKERLGLLSDESAYDSEILGHINTAFLVLNQLGAGEVYKPCTITETTVWNDVIGNEPAQEAIKSYIAQKVKQIFDTPTVGVVANALKDNITETEIRLLAILDR